MIVVKNWSSYQSYKDRKPPWIRFHKSMLDNYNYHGMSDYSRALLPMLWLLASEHEDPISGIIESNISKIAFRLRTDEAKINKSIDEIMRAGFIDTIQPCNVPVTKSYPIRNETVTPETETETESILPEFDSFWKEYPKKEGKKKAQELFNKLVKSGINSNIIIGGAISYANKMGRDPKFTKNATTWLNGAHWEDDLAVVERKAFDLWKN